MKRIGLISDTHGHIDDQILKNLEECDEIWHAGDIGNFNVIDALSPDKLKNIVFGNIDSGEIRRCYQKDLLWTCEGLMVFMTHIGGYPGRYVKSVKEILDIKRPHLYICGHSHILKIMKDAERDIIHINPGACGHHGLHKIRTMVRFSVKGDKLFDVEVIELGLRGRGEK